MKKIIQRTRRFEKSFGRLGVKTRKLFIKKLRIFIDDEYQPSFRTLKFLWKHQNEYAFSITDDVRVIYEKYSEKDQEVLIFTFIDIGAHDKVY